MITVPRFFLTILIISFYSTTHAQAPSFDCEKAERPVERMICSDLELSKMDRSISRAYASMSGGDSNASARIEQKKWLEMRNECASHECVIAAYVMRLAQLRRTKREEELVGLSSEEALGVCEQAILSTSSGSVRDFYLPASGSNSTNSYAGLDLDNDGVFDKIETDSGSFEANLSVTLSGGGGFEHTDGAMVLVDIAGKVYVLVTYRSNQKNEPDSAFHYLKMLTDVGVLPICDSWQGKGSAKKGFEK